MVSTSFIIYLGHFLSSWGDRMWYFAIPLFLMDLDPKSLFLTAAYGLTLAVSVLLFAPLVGDWIDRKPRLYAVTISLAIQNIATALSALILIINREFGEHDAPYAIGIQISAILLGAIGLLASTGTGIIIQKDWIVVVAAGKANFLADLNAMVRRIDLVTKVLSPLACGQIMAFTSLTGGAIFIVVWNCLSAVTEYLLLRAVYNRTPALATKHPTNEENIAMLEISEKDKKSATENTSDEKLRKKDGNKKGDSIFPKMFGFIIVIKDGWKLYMKQTITKAGVGLALLFMTHLNFGYITTAYAYNQCFSEFLVGILLGASAIAGIGGTYAFPWLRSNVGLVKAGVYSGIFQILTLIPCLASLYVPGSPFFMYAATHTPTITTSLTFPMTTTVLPTTYLPSGVETQSGVVNIPTGVSINTSFEGTVIYEGMTSDDNEELRPKILFKCLKDVTPPPSFMSLWLLLSGLIVARAGLWGFDLTVTQLIQENVAETERGIVNGVQTSLSMSMDMIAYILVLLLPRPDQFGILVMVSSAAVLVGHSLYGVFAFGAGEQFNHGGALSEEVKEIHEVAKEETSAVA